MTKGLIGPSVKLPPLARNVSVSQPAPLYNCFSENSLGGLPTPKPPCWRTSLWLETFGTKSGLERRETKGRGSHVAASYGSVVGCVRPKPGVAQRGPAIHSPPRHRMKPPPLGGGRGSHSPGTSPAEPEGPGEGAAG